MTMGEKFKAVPIETGGNGPSVADQLIAGAVRGRVIVPISHN